ncbi:hypothetical protein PTKIN_Ptkin19aG0129200 [Pterospermum kingtungense]
MEEEIVSEISSVEVKIENPEISDAVSTTHPANKRRRYGVNGTSSQHWGVMRQKNGQWGAQLYSNHNRIWLGTFKSEKDAAMAYDSATIKFCTGHPHRNFAFTDVTVDERKFLSLYGDEAFLSMIRDGTYQYRFMNFLRAQTPPKLETNLNSVGTSSNKGVIWRKMFQKELTPSDVGRLRRLVIPKRYAEKYFLAFSGSAKESVELAFYDNSMRLWKFRYCYWNSSQSYVLTRGWSRFLKENDLKANDVIAFYVRESIKENGVQRFLMIDTNKVAREVLDLELRLGLGHGFGGEVQVKEEPEDMEEWPNQELMPEHQNPNGFKLVGVKII